MAGYHLAVEPRGGFGKDHTEGKTTFVPAAPQGINRWLVSVPRQRLIKLFWSPTLPGMAGCLPVFGHSSQCPGGGGGHLPLQQHGGYRAPMLNASGLNVGRIVRTVRYYKVSVGRNRKMWPYGAEPSSRNPTQPVPRPQEMLQ